MGEVGVQGGGKVEDREERDGREVDELGNGG